MLGVHIHKLGCPKNIIPEFRRKVYYKMAEVLFIIYADYCRQSFFCIQSKYLSIAYYYCFICFIEISCRVLDLAL